MKRLGSNQDPVHVYYFDVITAQGHTASAIPPRCSLFGHHRYRVIYNESTDDSPKYEGQSGEYQ